MAKLIFEALSLKC
jgi:hypothetical protein